eukprot:759544-Prymnesium_polylepis.1
MVRTLLDTDPRHANASRAGGRKSCPRRFCAINLVGGELYLRRRGCNLKRPGWNLFSAMILAAAVSARGE